MKIKRFKLNALSAETLQRKELSSIVGGDTCGCGCLFAGQPGGSLTADNQNYNFQKGYFSELNYYVCDDFGYWRYEYPPMPIFTD